MQNGVDGIAGVAELRATDVGREEAVKTDTSGIHPDEFIDIASDGRLSEVEIQLEHGNASDKSAAKTEMHTEFQGPPSGMVLSSARTALPDLERHTVSAKSHTIRSNQAAWQLDGISGGDVGSRARGHGESGDSPVTKQPECGQAPDGDRELTSDDCSRDLSASMLPASSKLLSPQSPPRPYSRKGHASHAASAGPVSRAHAPQQHSLARDGMHGLDSTLSMCDESQMQPTARRQGKADDADQSTGGCPPGTSSASASAALERPHAQVSHRHGGQPQSILVRGVEEGQLGGLGGLRKTRGAFSATGSVASVEPGSLPSHPAKPTARVSPRGTAGAFSDAGSQSNTDRLDFDAWSKDRDESPSQSIEGREYAAAGDQYVPRQRPPARDGVDGAKGPCSTGNSSSDASIAVDLSVRQPAFVWDRPLSKRQAPPSGPAGQLDAVNQHADADDGRGSLSILHPPPSRTMSEGLRPNSQGLSSSRGRDRLRQRGARLPGDDTSGGSSGNIRPTVSVSHTLVRPRGHRRLSSDAIAWSHREAGLQAIDSRGGRWSEHQLQFSSHGSAHSLSELAMETSTGLGVPLVVRKGSHVGRYREKEPKTTRGGSGKKYKRSKRSRNPVRADRGAAPLQPISSSSSIQGPSPLGHLQHDRHSRPDSRSSAPDQGELRSPGQSGSQVSYAAQDVTDGGRVRRRSVDAILGKRGVLRMEVAAATGARHMGRVTTLNGSSNTSSSSAVSDVRASADRQAKPRLALGDVHDSRANSVGRGSVKSAFSRSIRKTSPKNSHVRSSASASGKDSSSESFSAKSSSNAQLDSPRCMLAKDSKGHQRYQNSRVIASPRADQMLHSPRSARSKSPADPDLAPGRKQEQCGASPVSSPSAEARSLGAPSQPADQPNLPDNGHAPSSISNQSTSQPDAGIPQIGIGGRQHSSMAPGAAQVPASGLPQVSAGQARNVVPASVSPHSVPWRFHMQHPVGPLPRQNYPAYGHVPAFAAQGFPGQFPHQQQPPLMTPQGHMGWSGLTGMPMTGQLHPHGQAFGGLGPYQQIQVMQGTPWLHQQHQHQQQQQQHQHFMQQQAQNAQRKRQAQVKQSHNLASRSPTLAPLPPSSAQIGQSPPRQPGRAGSGSPRRRRIGSRCQPFRKNIGQAASSVGSPPSPRSGERRTARGSKRTESAFPTHAMSPIGHGVAGVDVGRAADSTLSPESDMQRVSRPRSQQRHQQSTLEVAPPGRIAVVQPNVQSNSVTSSVAGDFVRDSGANTARERSVSNQSSAASSFGIHGSDGDTDVAAGTGEYSDGEGVFRASRHSLLIDQAVSVSVESSQYESSFRDSRGMHDVTALVALPEGHPLRSYESPGLDVSTSSMGKIGAASSSVVGNARPESSGRSAALEPEQSERPPEMEFDKAPQSVVSNFVSSASHRPSSSPEASGIAQKGRRTPQIRPFSAVVSRSESPSDSAGFGEGEVPSNQGSPRTSSMQPPLFMGGSPGSVPRKLRSNRNRRRRAPSSASRGSLSRRGGPSGGLGLSNFLDEPRSCTPLEQMLLADDGHIGDELAMQIDGAGSVRSHGGASQRSLRTPAGTESAVDGIDLIWSVEGWHGWQIPTSKSGDSSLQLDKPEEGKMIARESRESNDVNIRVNTHSMVGQGNEASQSRSVEGSSVEHRDTVALHGIVDEKGEREAPQAGLQHLLLRPVHAVRDRLVLPSSRGVQEDPLHELRSSSPPSRLRDGEHDPSDAVPILTNADDSSATHMSVAKHDGSVHSTIGPPSSNEGFGTPLATAMSVRGKPVHTKPRQLAGMRFLSSSSSHSRSRAGDKTPVLPEASPTGHDQPPFRAGRRTAVEGPAGQVSASPESANKGPDGGLDQATTLERQGTQRSIDLSPAPRRLSETPGRQRSPSTRSRSRSYYGRPHEMAGRRTPGPAAQSTVGSRPESRTSVDMAGLTDGGVRLEFAGAQGVRTLRRAFVGMHSSDSHSSVADSGMDRRDSAQSFGMAGTSLWNDPNGSGRRSTNTTDSIDRQRNGDIIFGFNRPNLWGDAFDERILTDGWISSQDAAAASIPRTASRGAVEDQQSQHEVMSRVVWQLMDSGLQQEAGAREPLTPLEDADHELDPSPAPDDSSRHWAASPAMLLQPGAGSVREHREGGSSEVVFPEKGLGVSPRGSSCHRLLQIAFDGMSRSQFIQLVDIGRSSPLDTFALYDGFHNRSHAAGAVDRIIRLRVGKAQKYLGSMRTETASACINVAVGLLPRLRSDSVLRTDTLALYMETTASGQIVPLPTHLPGQESNMALRTGDAARSMRALKQLAILAPRSGASFAALGHVLRAHECPEQADRTLFMAIKRYPGSPSVWQSWLWLREAQLLSAATLTYGLESLLHTPLEEARSWFPGPATPTLPRMTRGSLASMLNGEVLKILYHKIDSEREGLASIGNHAKDNMPLEQVWGILCDQAAVWEELGSLCSAWIKALQESTQDSRAAPSAVYMALNDSRRPLLSRTPTSSDRGANPMLGHETDHRPRSAGLSDTPAATAGLGVRTPRHPAAAVNSASMSADAESSLRERSASASTEIQRHGNQSRSQVTIGASAAAKHPDSGHLCVHGNLSSNAPENQLTAGTPDRSSYTQSSTGNVRRQQEFRSQSSGIVMRPAASGSVGSPHSASVPRSVSKWTQHSDADRSMQEQDSDLEDDFSPGAEDLSGLDLAATAADYADDKPAYRDNHFCKRDPHRSGRSAAARSVSGQAIDAPRTSNLSKSRGVSSRELVKLGQVSASASPTPGLSRQRAQSDTDTRQWEGNRETLLRRSVLESMRKVIGLYRSRTRVLLMQAFHSAKSITSARQASGAVWKVLAQCSRYEAVHGEKGRALLFVDAAHAVCDSKSKHDLLLEKARVLEACHSVEAARRQYAAVARQVQDGLDSAPSKTKARALKQLAWKCASELASLETRAGNHTAAVRIVATELKRQPEHGRLWAALCQASCLADCSSKKGGAMSSVPLDKLLAEAVRSAPRSGEVWVEVARYHLNPCSGAYSTRLARRALQFARELTGQYGDAYVESLRLHMLCVVGFASQDDPMGLASARELPEELGLDLAGRLCLEAAHRLVMIDSSSSIQQLGTARQRDGSHVAHASVHETSFRLRSESASARLRSQLRHLQQDALEQPWAVSCQSNYGLMFSVCRPLRSSSPKVVLAATWEVLSTELAAMAAVYAFAAGADVSAACSRLQQEFHDPDASVDISEQHAFELVRGSQQDTVPPGSPTRKRSATLQSLCQGTLQPGDFVLGLSRPSRLLRSGALAAAMQRERQTEAGPRETCRMVLFKPDELRRRDHSLRVTSAVAISSSLAAQADQVVFHVPTGDSCVDVEHASLHRGSAPRSPELASTTRMTPGIDTGATQGRHESVSQTPLVHHADENSQLPPEDKIAPASQDNSGLGAARSQVQISGQPQPPSGAAPKRKGRRRRRRRKKAQQEGGAGT